MDKVTNTKIENIPNIDLEDDEVLIRVKSDIKSIAPPMKSNFSLLQKQIELLFKEMPHNRPDHMGELVAMLDKLKLDALELHRLANLLSDVNYELDTRKEKRKAEKLAAKEKK